MAKVGTGTISSQQVKDFERDGVIHIKKAVDNNWIERMRTALERNLSNSVGIRGSQKKGVHVTHDYGLWLKDADFRALVFESPLPTLAAQVLKSEKLNFLSDGFFVKKPTAQSSVVWHNDQPYWPVQGWKCCKIWLALDPVTKENGRLEYIKGSHLWKKELDDRLENPWFLESEPREVIYWDMEPGDCLIHHFLTIHHSVSNTSFSVRRAIVTNWSGDDVTYKYRPNTWPYIPVEEINIPGFNSMKTLKNGEQLDCDVFPKIELNY
ncbi:phytanoyl-CoA dioxygenase family protein [Aetokthonos hydrillicola Thurmond2011]|jgi:ectoine hydroxylase-related dioxygenase (phytanoyl-CoA dioxygenase family)|uniref:Phytanoyl-CoA dioxygenase family protein n=1 Tax=Aetokthonos hydrillicola Thurmond2011 TaxID=2712845 RepID=A0AAP5M949_9CYAN|nr:phytanoyl-CoA dioxygenase family protein [Aetokthonos hydrillicola]MBO3463236.1 phytanoyl-CoA dioxygenase family protein [Aetokthonos hydrillicola CCALA 1050]MBW4590709.1 phytanoyl-CoA dioxygenase family protein [Aetokthonos hydrillicola CCALA 1050]MDR9899841.1 phytanoyl-CoA dioxygenase family protein [Aetokthonos hydrillicola Thurmond2011]